MKRRTALARRFDEKGFFLLLAKEKKLYAAAALFGE